MNEDEIKLLIQRHEKAMFILGVSTTLLLQSAYTLPENGRSGIKWVLDAVENAFYKDEPLPPFPDVGI